MTGAEVALYANVCQAAHQLGKLTPDDELSWEVTTPEWYGQDGCVRVWSGTGKLLAVFHASTGWTKEDILKELKLLVAP